jgi:hypothetical protein
MTDADARLKALFQEDAPAALDARFRLAALERIQRRRTWVRLALVGAAGAVATAAVAVLGPQLTQALGGLPVIAASVAIAVAATGWGVMQMSRPI